MTINSGHDARDDGGPETFDGSGPRLHTGELEALLDDVMPRPPRVPRPRGADDPYVGLVVDRRYEIEALIAAGGMGLVYRCRHSVLGKKLAIKIIRGDVAHMPGGLQRFLIEAKAASSVGNEHIVDISDFGALPDGSPYIVMELLDGVPLSVLAQQKQRLALARIIGIARQIAEGLGAAHAIGIVHRDLKPDNLLVLERKGEDFVKILDFGVARMVESAKKLTQVGTIIGTPHYMSPEQASGEDVDARGDIYSLGVILYELCAGRVPFDGEHYLAVLHQHRSVPPPPLASLEPPVQVPRTFEHVIRRCLEKSRDGRYASMAELSADLAFVLASQSFAAAAARSLAPVASEAHPRESGRGLASAHASPVLGTIVNASPPEPCEAESSDAAAPERGSDSTAGDDGPPETVRYAEPRPDAARGGSSARARRGAALPTLVQASATAAQAAGAQVAPVEPAASRQTSANASTSGAAPAEQTLVLPHTDERRSPAYRRWVPALALAAALAAGVWAVSSVPSEKERATDVTPPGAAPATGIDVPATASPDLAVAAPALAPAPAGDTRAAPPAGVAPPASTPPPAPSAEATPPAAPSPATSSAETQRAAAPAAAVPAPIVEAAPLQQAAQPSRSTSKKAARKRRATAAATPLASSPSPARPETPSAEAPRPEPPREREGFMNPWPAPH